MNDEIVILMVIIGIIMFFIGILSEKYFSNKKLKRLEESFVQYIPPAEVVFNKENFNNWFCNDDNNAIYAHKGIFLRTDKLSISHVTDYISKCYNMDATIYEDKIEQFYWEIKKDWLNKIGINEKTVFDVTL